MVEKTRDDGVAFGPPRVGQGNVINVSIKKDPNFYVFLGKKYLETHEVIELHAMGNAAPGAVIASENLVRHNYAIFGDIRTQAITVQSNNYRGESKKPKLFIVLKRHPEFFENMKKLLTAHFDHLKVDPALANALPLPGLQDRNVVGTIWSFHGRKKGVIKLTLVLNRASRAFMIRLKGLHGVLSEYHDNAMSWSHEVQTSATFRAETLGFLEEELGGLLAKLALAKKPEDIVHLLRLSYPGAYVAYLKAMGKTEEIQKLYDGYENFTWYIVGEIIPELHKLRSEDRLKKGSKAFVEDFQEFEYEGELFNGMAHGRGKYKRWGETVEGMFYMDKLHGFCIRSDHQYRRIFEYKAGVQNGKGTSFKENEDEEEVENYVYKNGVEKSFLSITYVADHAFFTKLGKPLQAVAENWRDFKGIDYDKIED